MLYLASQFLYFCVTQSLATRASMPTSCCVPKRDSPIRARRPAHRLLRGSIPENHKSKAMRGGGATRPIAQANNSRLAQCASRSEPFLTSPQLTRELPIFCNCSGLSTGI